MSRLDRILRPRSIAAIGGLHAGRVIEQCQLMGFEGELWPVHPSKKAVQGLPAYPSIDALPGSPDAAFVGVNRQLSIAAVKQLQALNAGGAICYAAGFSELDAVGVDLQASLIQAAGDMPVLGPNCYGLINFSAGALLWPDQQGGARLALNETGVAIIAQSSNIAINFTMQQRGLPLAYIVTVGNQAMVGMSELALSLLDDPSVTTLGLYIEGFDSIAQLEKVAEKSRLLQKPVVILKVGRSHHSQNAALSHTASLVGSAAANSAFLRRCGFGEARSIPTFLESLKLLHHHGPLCGYRLSSMSCSGGEASIIADLAENTKLQFPCLSNAHRERVQQALGPKVSVANPLDYNTYCWGKRDELLQVYQAMLSPEAFDLNFLIIDFPHPDRCVDDEWLVAAEAFDAAQKTTGARGALVCGMQENISETHSSDFQKRGLLCLHGMEEALNAAQIAADIGITWSKPISAALLPPSPALPGLVTLNEAEAKQKLAAFGIPVPVGVCADSVASALSVVDQIGGFPLVVKALGIAHKTEQAAVRLNISTRAQLEQVAAELLALSPAIYLEEMIQGVMLELIIGITRDQQLGLVLTIGSGGVWVEILKDSQTLLIPTNNEQIEQALLALKCAPILMGYRGQSAVDLPALVNLILGVQNFAMAQSQSLVELEINPLMLDASGKRMVAADALIINGDS